MTGLLLRHLVQAVFVALPVSFAVRLSGDPTASLLTGSGEITQADLDRIRASLGRSLSNTRASYAACWSAISAFTLPSSAGNRWTA